MPGWLVVMRERRACDPQANFVEAETVEDARSLIRDTFPADVYARVSLIPWSKGKTNIRNRQIIAERKNLETRNGQ